MATTRKTRKVRSATPGSVPAAAAMRAPRQARPVSRGVSSSRLRRALAVAEIAGTSCEQACARLSGLARLICLQHCRMRP